MVLAGPLFFITLPGVLALALSTAVDTLLAFANFA